MTWIKTVPFEEADERLRRAIEAQRELYPKEYADPVHPVGDGETSGIVASHSLIPDALYHAFATFVKSLVASVVKTVSLNHKVHKGIHESHGGAGLLPSRM